MVDPVSGGIRREGEVTYGITVDIVIELKEDAEAGVCKNGMRGFSEYVIAWKTFFGSRESLRCQVLLDREMWKLYDLVAFPLDDGDETRTYRYHRFFRIFWTPGCVKCRGFSLVELNCKNLREFFDTKRADRYRETSKEPLRIFSFLLIDSQ
jgi:hypothetical protein